jgi:pyruvate/2-oxoglutarate dehydrogenase complex dihydrolipoamide dehydrogenase (E3) component
MKYFTNETIFDNDVLPEHLIIVGGGPIGVEIGQAADAAPDRKLTSRNYLPTLE